MIMPDKKAARTILHEHVSDVYQRFHAEMVAAAMAGYARLREEDEALWWLTGLMHDVDYDQHPHEHPGPSLQWFKDWGYSQALIHAVEAHADGFNGFTVKPETDLARGLVACDEICGIFYAYQRLNPVPFGDMKASSILKRIKDERFAPGINREHIKVATENFGLTLETHVANLITFLAVLDAEHPPTS